MRNFILFLFFGLGLFSCNEKKSSAFTIEGRVDNINDSIVIYLIYFIQKDGIWDQITDSTCLKNNKFFIEGNIDELTAAWLVFSDSHDIDIEIPIYMEPVAMKLSIDKNNPYAYKLSGTSVEKESIELRNILFDNQKIIDQINDSIGKIFNETGLYTNDPDSVDSLMQIAYQYRAERTIYTKSMDSLRLDFINKHITYRIIPNLLYTLARDCEITDIDTVAAIYDGLPERSKTTLLGKLALEQIKESKRIVKGKDILIGDTAPDFSRVSMQGDTLSLADFRGKSCILLDFWASWCGPCIHGIPDIKNVYDKYNKNLKIIGISIESSREDWTKAVAEHQTGMWPQILSAYLSDNNCFGNEMDISKIYHVYHIPTYILIDKQGKVTAVWHHIGEEELKEIDKILQIGLSHT